MGLLDTATFDVESGRFLYDPVRTAVSCLLPVAKPYLQKA